MTDFKVVLGDLSTLASRYSAEAVNFKAVAAKLDLTSPDTGDGGLTSSIDALLGLLTAANGRLTTSLYTYSDQIADARHTYEITEDENKNRFLYDNMMEGFE